MRRRLVLPAAVAALALLVAGAIYGGRELRRACESSPRFAIRDIAVDGDHRLDVRAIAAAAGVALGENLFRLDPALAEARLATHPWIASADVRRRFPHGVAISVVEREPVALVYGPTWVAVDSSGALLPLDAVVEERFDLPILTGCGAPEALDRDRLRRGAAFADLVARERPLLARDLSEVSVADSTGLAAYTMRSGTEVLFGANGYSEKLARLLPVLEDLSGSHEIPVTIDLRFAGQAVVRFQKPATESGGNA
jgi:cell division protein FtsQ